MRSLVFVASLFLLSAFYSPAQSIPSEDYATPLPSIENTLSELLINLQKLKAKLTERSIALSEAQSQLVRLQNELTEAQNLLATSRKRLAESKQEIEKLIDLLRQSQQISEELRTTFEEYRRESSRQRIRAWLIGGGIGAVVGFVAALFIR